MITEIAGRMLLAHMAAGWLILGVQTARNTLAIQHHKTARDRFQRLSTLAERLAAPPMRHWRHAWLPLLVSLCWPWLLGTAQRPSGK